MFYKLATFFNDLSLSADNFTDAAEKNNVDLLKILVEKQCPYNDKTIKAIVKNDHIEIFKSLNQKIPKAIEFAALYGKLSFVKYLNENGYELTKDTYYNALESKNEELIKWLCDINKEGFLYNPVFTALKNKQYELVKWMIENEVGVINHGVFSLAFRSGDMDFINFLLSKKKFICYCDECEDTIG